MGARAFGDTYGAVKAEYNFSDPKVQISAQASARGGLEVARAAGSGRWGKAEFDASIGAGAANVEATLAVMRSAGPNPVQVDAGFQGGADVALVKGQAKYEYEFSVGPLTVKPAVVAEGHLLGAGVYGAAGVKTYKTRVGGELYVGGGLTALIGGRLKVVMGVSWDSTK